MATVAEWVEGARIRTLPAAASPVLAGSATALMMGSFKPWVALLCLVIALLLQIGVNFSNDYSDGIRGTDSEERVGPQRLVGSGAAAPKTVLTAALICYSVACVAGLVLTFVSGHWWYPLVGLASVLAAWFYTGGKNPYGYLGLGEVFVFLFFGVVAVAGTTHAQAGRVDIATWFAVIGIGCLACAILVCNNLRDIHTDRQSGKRTLETMIGDRSSRLLFVLLILVAVLSVVGVAMSTSWWLLLGLLCLVFLAGPVKMIWRGATGLRLVHALKLTGIGELTYGAGLLLGASIASVI